MRNAPSRWSASHDRVVRGLHAVEHPGELLAECVPAYAVDVKDGSVRREARPDRRNGVVFGPIDKFRQTGPVRLILKSGRSRLGPRHNQAIEMACPQLTDVFVVLADMRPAGVRTSKLR